jgi:hypothetical protein
MGLMVPMGDIAALALLIWTVSFFLFATELFMVCDNFGK